MSTQAVASPHLKPSLSSADDCYWTIAIATALRSTSLSCAFESFAEALRALTRSDRVELVCLAYGKPLFSRLHPSAAGDTPASIRAHPQTECSQDGYAETALEYPTSGQNPRRVQVRLLAAPGSAEPICPVPEIAWPLVHLALEHLFKVAGREACMSSDPMPLLTANSDLIERAIRHLLSDTLSPREREITSALLGGESPKFIARELRIAPATVRNHIRHIYAKLGVSSRSELLGRVLKSILATQGAAHLTPAGPSGPPAGHSESAREPAATFELR